MLMEDSGGRAHTDLDIGALVVGNARVGGACGRCKQDIAQIGLAHGRAASAAYQGQCRWHRRKLRRSYWVVGMGW